MNIYCWDIKQCKRQQSIYKENCLVCEESMPKTYNFNCACLVNNVVRTTIQVILKSLHKRHNYTTSVGNKFLVWYVLCMGLSMYLLCPPCQTGTCTADLRRWDVQNSVHKYINVYLFMYICTNVRIHYQPNSKSLLFTLTYHGDNSLSVTGN